MNTKTIEILVPDTFTDEQTDFIKKSAMNQIENEMKRELKIPQADIDEVNTKVKEIRDKMGIIESKPPVDLIEEPI